MSHEHLEFTHADSGSWAPPPFLLLLQGGGGCCNHRFSLSVCCFSSCGAPAPKAGWLRGFTTQPCWKHRTAFWCGTSLLYAIKPPYSRPDGLGKWQVPISQGSRELVVLDPMSRATPGPHNVDLQLFAESTLRTAVPCWHHGEPAGACSRLCKLCKGQSFVTAPLISPLIQCSCFSHQYSLKSH